MRKRWRIFAVLALMYLVAYFYRVSMAVVAKDLAAEFQLPAPRIGILSGALFYAFALAQIPLGPLLDRFGGRRIVSLFGLLTVAGSFLFALAPGFLPLLAGRLLIGAGTAAVLMGALKVFTRWFSPREYATVSGLIVAVGNLGNLTATAPLAWAVSLAGWRPPFVAVGAVQLAVTLLVFAVVRDAPPSPSAAGAAGAAATPAAATPLADWGTVFRTPSFWLLALLAFFWYAGYMALQGLWGGPWLMEILGLSRTGAGRLLLLVSTGFITGCLGLGTVADRLFKSRKRTLLAGQGLLLGLLTLTLGPAERLSGPLLALLFFAFGLAVSSGVTIYPMVKEMFPPRISATASTALNFFVLTGAATVQQAMGLVIGRFPRGAAGYPAAAYHSAFLIPVCGLAMAWTLFLFVRDTTPGKH
ncbi:MFS transporter [Geotalea uraniireducens]|uniref:Lysosomal dipeptide transporter MFSD1 n=1 Tax=Geotalea uraniireducens TaxID=351604 RepID=A0ABM8EQQ7_9BACT|nr:MFS transporter [Geotalea uraniireducens]BDV44898.1 MFS transporter [Geotalea uraniireducens]